MTKNEFLLHWLTINNWPNVDIVEDGVGIYTVPDTVPDIGGREYRMEAVESTETPEGWAIQAEFVSDELVVIPED